MIKKIKTIWNLKKEYDSVLEELEELKDEKCITDRNIKIYEYKMKVTVATLESKAKGLESTIKTRELHIKDLKKQVKNLQKQIKDLKKDGYNKGYEKGKAESKIVTLYLEGTRSNWEWEVICGIVDDLGKETFGSDLEVPYKGGFYKWELTEYNAGRVAHEIVTKYSNVLERRADLYCKFKNLYFNFK